MKLTITLALALFFVGMSTAQTINFELTTPAPQLQDADIGAMAFGDIDNDGDMDLMITGKGGPVKSTLYKNDGSGGFTEVTGTPFENVFNSTVRFEDIDNDNDLDLLIIGKTSAPLVTAKLYKNDGAGNYSLVANTPFEPSEGGDFAFGDIDNDNDSDLILMGYNAQGSGFTKLYLNNGSGQFSEVTTSFEGLKNSSVKFLDIDNDNDLDVIMAGENNSNTLSTKLYINDGTGSYSLISNTPFDNFDSGDIAVGDSDNDGDVDVFICGSNSNGVIISKLYLNDGMGQFSLLTQTPFAPVFLGETSFADFDNDGDMDLFIIGSGSGGFNNIHANVYENQGANNYILADALTGAYLSSHAVGDIDGDNDLDLVLGGTFSSTPTRATRMYTNLTPTTSTIRKDKIQLEARIAPNPSDGFLNIEFKEETSAAVEIFTMTGQCVYVEPNLVGVNHQIHLDLSNGLYILVLRTKDAVQTQKLMIKK